METKKMTEGNPIKLMILFALPLMVGNVFQQLYIVVDTMVVGKRLGLSALAALGSVDWLNWMMLGIIQGFTQGFGVKIAQRFGAGDKSGLKKAVVNAGYLSLIFALFLTILSLLIAQPVLRLLRTPGTIIGMSLQYLFIAFCGIPIIFAYNYFACILRAVGNSKAPLQAMVVACFTNIFLDILFVLVFDFGIRGAACATILAQCVAAGFCLFKITKIKDVMPNKESLSYDGTICLEHLKIGVPMVFQNVLIAIGGMILQFVVNGFGVIFLAGYTATNKLYGILEIAATSYGFAMSTYAGQNMGAGRIDRIRKGTKDANLVGIATALLIMLLMLLFGRTFLGWFIAGDVSDADQALAYAFYYLKIMSYCLPILYILHVVRSCLQGMGYPFFAMLSGVAEFIMRTAGIIVLPMIFGEVSVFFAEVLAWGGADFVLVPSYFYLVRKVDDHNPFRFIG